MTRVSLLVISVVATISPMRQFFLLVPLLLLIGFLSAFSSPLMAQEGNTTINWKVFSKNNLNDVKAEIELHHSIDFSKITDASGRTPLMYASRNNQNAEVISYLIKIGSDVNAEASGWTPLLFAAQENNRAEIISSLIDGGANVKAETDGWRAVDLIVKNEGDIESLISLLENGADANRAFNNSLTITSDPNVISTFIDYGADINASETDGTTPLMLAIDYATDEKIVKRLLRLGADPNKENNEGFTPLFLASRDTSAAKESEAFLRNVDTARLNITAEENIPNINILKTLIENGADVKYSNKIGYTALHIAAINPNPVFASLLLKHGANIHARTDDGATPLALSVVMCSDMATMSTLLNAGANIHARTDDGATLLHHAAAALNPVGIKFLADKGLDVSAPDDIGRTPLKYAEMSGTWFGEAFTLLNSLGAQRESDNFVPLVSMNGPIAQEVYFKKYWYLAVTLIALIFLYLYSYTKKSRLLTIISLIPMSAFAGLVIVILCQDMFLEARVRTYIGPYEISHFLKPFIAGSLIFLAMHRYSHLDVFFPSKKKKNQRNRKEN